MQEQVPPSPKMTEKIVQKIHIIVNHQEDFFGLNQRASFLKKYRVFTKLTTSYSGELFDMSIKVKKTHVYIHR